MKAMSAYIDNQSLTLDAESAFSELYVRLARWSEEIVVCQLAGQGSQAVGLIDKSLNLLAAMDRLIDLNGHKLVVSGIMGLHRFAIRTLICAKAQSDAALMKGLDGLFLELSELFIALNMSNSIAQPPAESHRVQ